MKVEIERRPEFLGMAVYFYDEKDGETYLVKPMELEIEKWEAGRSPPPTLLFRDRSKGYEFLQSLADALSRSGFKPDEIKAHDKEVVALKNHLEDMRVLAMRNARLQRLV